MANTPGSPEDTTTTSPPASARSSAWRARSRLHPVARRCRRPGDGGRRRGRGRGRSRRGRVARGQSLEHRRRAPVGAAGAEPDDGDAAASSPVRVPLRRAPAPGTRTSEKYGASTPSVSAQREDALAGAAGPLDVERLVGQARQRPAASRTSARCRPDLHDHGGVDAGERLLQLVGRQDAGQHGQGLVARHEGRARPRPRRPTPT